MEFVATDSTSILIKDHRSGAHQLLTLGDARVVTELCTNSWQGGISTISPLSLTDCREILENHRNWSLADYDVTAFSYAPIPCWKNGEGIMNINARALDRELTVSNHVDKIDR